MPTKSKTTESAPKLKAWYSIRELADMVGCPKRQILRLLTQRQVKTEKIGKKHMVSLAAFQYAFPDLWESILTVSQLSQE